MKFFTKNTPDISNKRPSENIKPSATQSGFVNFLEVKYLQLENKISLLNICF